MASPRSCVIKGCKPRKRQLLNKSFCHIDHRFKFPTDPEIRRLWITFVLKYREDWNRDAVTLTDNDKICMHHFCTSDFTEKHSQCGIHYLLKPTAVPSIPDPFSQIAVAPELNDAANLLLHFSAEYCLHEDRATTGRPNQLNPALQVLAYDNSSLILDHTQFAMPSTDSDHNASSFITTSEDHHQSDQDFLLQDSTIDVNTVAPELKDAANLLLHFSAEHSLHREDGATASDRPNQLLEAHNPRVSTTTSTRSVGTQTTSPILLNSCCQTDSPPVKIRNTTSTQTTFRKQCRTSTPYKRKLEESMDDSIPDAGAYLSPSDASYSLDSSCTSIEIDEFTVPPHRETNYIVCESALLELHQRCTLCMHLCTIHKSLKGTLLTIVSECNNCSNKTTWRGQRNVKETPVVNLLLSSAIILTGCPIRKALRMFEAMNIPVVHECTVHRHSKEVIQSVIYSHWNKKQAGFLTSLPEKEKRQLALGGDGRADSPGHSAKYMSYCLMSLKYNRIVALELIQSNEEGVRSSTRMEKEGLVRALQQLDDHGCKVESLVTDRHPQITKFVREQCSFKHYYDVWHVSKGIKKKLEAASKEKGCETLKPWVKSISNHLYWAAASSTTEQEKVAKWTSVINHIQDIHVHENDVFPACTHGPLDERNKLWIQPSTKASSKVEAIVGTKRLKKDVQKLSNSYQTSNIESFFSLVQHFAPKNTCFSFKGMLCRVMLAGLHYNENANRGIAKTRAGVSRFSISFPKAKRGEHTVRPIKTKPTYRYLKELVDEIVILIDQNDSEQPSSIKEVVVPPNLCSSFIHPSKEDAVRTKRTRFVNKRLL